MIKSVLLRSDFLSDRRVQRLNQIEKLLFIYLMTNSRIHMSGIYHTTFEIIAEETAIPIEKLAEAFFNLYHNDELAFYDKDNQTVWVTMEFIKGGYNHAV